MAWGNLDSLLCDPRQRGAEALHFALVLRGSTLDWS